MRRVVLLCFGVVSCASPDLPRVDGVPEDPGNHTPTLPTNTTPEAPVVPNDSETTADGTDDAERSQADAGAAGVQPVPSTTTPPATNTTTPATSAESDETFADATEAPITSGDGLETAEATLPGPASDAGAAAPACDFDGGLEGDGGAVSDAGDVSVAEGECDGR
jgi:hypothetical protein